MRAIWAKIRYLFHRESHPWDLSEEIETHLQMEIEANIERGMSLNEARRVARREFGNPERLRESAQEAWVFRWLESVLQDIRYGLRQFRRAPGVFLAVVASLAIGLGSSTAIFSLIEAAVLRPLPVADPDRLIHLHWRNDEQPAGVFRVQRRLPDFQTGGLLEASNVSEPLFRTFADEQTGFTSLIGIVSDSDEVAVSASSDAPAEQVRTLYVSRDFFDGLGVPLVLGRSFVDEEDRPGAEPAVIVSHRFWSSRLGRDPDAIGQIVRIDGEPARIVGVAPPGFFGPLRGYWIDVYQPLAAAPTIQGFETSNWTVDMVARLPLDVSGPDAAAAMTPLFRNLVAESMGTEVEEELELFARPAARGLYWTSPRQRAIEEVSQALRILMLLVGVLLLIVCANVANLLMSRSERRRRESAVRLALGAGRWRLIRQHLVESGMLAVIGGAAGLVLGAVLARSIHAFFQTGQSSSDAFAVMLDWRVFGYAAAVTLLTVLLFGLAPAWTAARPKVDDALRIQSRSVLGGGLRIPRFLVSAQFALSFAALIAAGLLGRSLGNLYSTDLGFDGEQLSYATVHPNRAGYTPPDLGSYIERLRQEIAAIPGVLAVAPLNDRLLDGGSLPGPIFASGGQLREIGDRPVAPDMVASIVGVGPGIVDALGLRLLAGRAIEAGDRCSRPGPDDEEGSNSLCPALVDERFAESLLPGEPAIGKRFEAGLGVSTVVVGVVANARDTLREDAVPTVYQPVGLAEGFTLSGTHFAIRAQIDSSALAAAVQQAVARVDPAVPLAEFHTQSGLVDRLLRTERMLALVSGAFTLAALALAAVGLGGLLAYAVARRTNEIGIRMALGATGGEVRRMVLGDSLRMVSIGLLIGVPAAYAVGQYLESLLFGLEPIDLSTALLALVALLVIAGLASLLPARRAASVNPMTALRDE